ncbi:hypothetical protein [Prauserella muralis]|uniref:Uncharacterized protein n=1 Tax=Prauserella muralis TaxID=588067 RepID=A0A2V4ALN4_9PSEU|nr:hypothetical protein [Prauserella muralis]PXY20913.1 hypothetical protein BAY60_25800 [Prauserella muralis]TWE29963.1 hypothetical protein FHX69_2657 [Prauserella muralis]
MNEDTRAMLAALAALRNDLDEGIEALRRGELTVPRQHELAASLIEVGEQLDDHADHQAATSNGHADGYGFGEQDGIASPHDDEEA